MITAQQLRKISPAVGENRSVIIAQLINEKCLKYGITDVNVLHEFLANVLHESGSFSIKAENMNYTTPQRLVAIWPSRFSINATNGKKIAAMFVHNARLLANEVYNGRMGNRPGSNDGFEFRGGGFAQITGRDAYTLFTAYINKTATPKFTIQQLALLVMVEDEWAMESAFWFFCEFKNLEQMALQDNFKELVKRWNGGFIGLDDREKYYTRCKQVLQ